jgi:hypothetical protein
VVVSLYILVIDEISKHTENYSIASEGNSVTGKEPIIVRMGIKILNCLKKGAKAIGKQRYPEVEVKGKKAPNSTVHFPKQRLRRAMQQKSGSQGQTKQGATIPRN